MTLKVEGLTPRAWLNRCAQAFPTSAAQALEGITGEDGEVLLKELTERFEAFDEYIGRCPVLLDPSFVADTRLLLGSLKKFREPMGEASELEAAAERRFVANNEAAKQGQVPPRFRGGMKEFLAAVLQRYSEKPCNPHFGPGAVEERLSQVQRWNAIPKTGLYDWREPDDVYRWGCTGLREPCARLQAVPKDWNKKRLITVEPYEQSYLQHYTRESLLAALRHSKVAGLRALANPKWRDPQLRHRVLACRGSMDGSLATLDMSDASDLVSFSQVAEVFPSEVVADLERCRSTQYRMADGTLADVHMFAGMGNAATFPVETLMFHAACYAVARWHRLPFRDSFVSVFGDDMIVSTRLATLLVENGIFAEFGWRINQNKSYWRSDSRFRESCGGQYYNGHDVTLLRYHGGYDGIEGLVAYRDLIMRTARNPRWRALTWVPWEEQNMLNSQDWVTEGALFTSVPWWPDTIDYRSRWNPHLYRPELECPTVKVDKRILSDTQLGCVYGAIAGQLAGQTGTRRIRGRKVYGVVVPVPHRETIVRRWDAVAKIDLGHPEFGRVAGLPNAPTDMDLIRARLRKKGLSS